MLLIDVAFYLKCLQRSPTVLLCGPVSNETHACMHACMRSVGNAQRPQWTVVSEDPRHGGHSLNLPGIPPRLGAAHLLTWVERGGWSSSSWLLGPAVLVLSAWSSSGPSPTAHMEDFRRISTPEEGMKGSGASVQGSAWGSTFDLPPSTDSFVLNEPFIQTFGVHAGLSASLGTPESGTFCWETAFFQYRFTGWGGVG